jgi:HEAT repeat protein
MSEPGHTAPVDSRDSQRDIERVELFFTAVDKTLRGHRLYQGQGALVERLLGDLATITESMLVSGPVAVRVASVGVVYKGRRVTEDARRVPYLFRLFCDGVREITFLPGLSKEELRALLGVLSSDPKAGVDDMVTLLWRQNLEHLRYYAADTLAQGIEVDGDGEILLAGAKGGLVNRAATGSTSITLTAQDFKLLVSEGQRDWLKLAKAPSSPEGKAADAAALLRRTYRSNADYARFVQIALKRSSPGAPSPLLLGYVDALIAAGQAAPFRACVEALVGVPDPLQAAARSHLEYLGRAESLVRLAAAVDREPEVLVPVLSPFVPLARDGLVALLNLLSGVAQEHLLDLLLQGGVDLTPYYGERSRSDDEPQAVAALRALGRIGSPEAIKHLSAALGRSSANLRKTALEAMRGHYHPDARVALARSLKDPVKENRLLAAQALAASGDPRSAWGLLSVVEDVAFADRDADEQVLIYGALSSFKDNRTLAHFDEILSRRNLFRNKAVIERQLLVVKALAEVGTPEARQILEKYRGLKSLPDTVQSAIVGALNASRRS